MKNSAGLYYVQADQLGTPRVITDGSQAVIWSWSSDPFGNGQPTGPLTYNLRFPGQYYDAETGHNYNYERDYDPSTGRYIESDPIGLGSGINTYTYTYTNLLKYADFFGACPNDCEQQVQDDEEQCRQLPNQTREDKAIRSRCWASANERYGDCEAGRPVPPLVTWSETAPLIPITPPQLPAPPPPNTIIPIIITIIIIPWPGNPIYGGL